MLYIFMTVSDIDQSVASILTGDHSGDDPGLHRLPSLPQPVQLQAQAAAEHSGQTHIGRGFLAQHLTQNIAQKYCKT